MGRQVFAAEVSLEFAPAGLREKFPTDGLGVKALIHKYRIALDEVAIVSTETRFIVYAVGDSIDPLLNFFLQDPELFRYVQFYKNTEATVNHLFATATGLCSNVKGERQIINHIETGYNLARECNSVGLILDQLFKGALKSAENIRKATGIDKFSASVVDTAFSVVYEKLENIYDQKFLIIGTGEIARLTLNYLSNEGLSHVTLICSDLITGAQLANQYNIQLAPIEDIPHHLSTADVILGENHEVLNAPESWSDVSFNKIRKAMMAKRRILIDLGMPKNLTKRLQEFDTMLVYNIHTLKKMQLPSQQGIDKLDAAWKMVAEEAKIFQHFIEQVKHAPVLSAFFSRFMDNAAAAVKKDVAVNSAPHLYKHIRPSVRQPMNGSFALICDRHANLKKEAVIRLIDFSSVKINLCLN